MATYKVVMVRHGESEWNKLNKFCGWFDADLSELGIEEAKSAGKILADKKYKFDVAYTSVLKRAIKTLYLIQDEMDLHWIPVEKSWRLNERMYGELQGLNKAETVKLHGEAQVQIWRRGYATPPNPVDVTSEMYPGNDDKYKFVDKNLIPRAECLKDTLERVLPFWYDTIVPAILQGKQILISAHGNSLRALVKYLDNVSEDDIMKRNIPTGIPLVYELDANLRPIRNYYLADDEKVKAAEAKVAAQTKTN